MKILLINNTHYIGGGADRVYLNTAELLTSKGHEVMFFSTLDENNYSSENTGSFVDKTDFRSANFIEKIKGSKNYLYNKEVGSKLNELIQEFKPDLAHLHLFYGNLTSSVLKTLKRNKTPIVHTVHDYRLLCPANAFLDAKNNICEKCKPKKYYKCTTNKCSSNNLFFSSILSMEGYIRKYVIDPLTYINHFVFVSDFSKRKHISFDSRFEEKSSHAYNFTKLLPKSESNKGDYFLYFGRLSKEKGVTTLLSAIENTNLKLKIAGTGPLELSLKNDFESDSVEFLGHKSSNELKNIISNASYIIVPSEWYENNPMTIIESYSHGKPVIGARIGGIPEIIIDNETGFLFESRNSIELKNVLIKANALSNQEYDELSINARDFAENNFSAEANYKHLEEVYLKLITT